MFGETFSLNPMFTFFAVQTQLHFSTAANYENNLPPNVGLRPDGGLCSRRAREGKVVNNDVRSTRFGDFCLL